MRKQHLLQLAEMQDVLGISERTARRYLINPAGIPAPERTLWDLHCAGRIVPEHWAGVRFHDGQLITNTEYKLAYGQVLQYAWHLDCLDLILRDLARVAAKVKELEARGLKLAQREREKLDKLTEVQTQLADGLPDLIRPAPLSHRSDGC